MSLLNEADLGMHLYRSWASLHLGMAEGTMCPPHPQIQKVWNGYYSAWQPSAAVVIQVRRGMTAESCCSYSLPYDMLTGFMSRVCRHTGGGSNLGLRSSHY